MVVVVFFGVVVVVGFGVVVVVLVVVIVTFLVVVDGFCVVTCLDTSVVNGRGNVF